MTSFSKNRHGEPMGECHIAELRLWGPWMGRSADSPSAGGLSWAALSDPHWSWPVLSGLNLVLGLHLVCLSLILCSDIFCDFMSSQSVLATCILAQKHTLHILEGREWFRGLFG